MSKVYNNLIYENESYEKCIGILPNTEKLTFNEKTRIIEFQSNLVDQKTWENIKEIDLSACENLKEIDKYRFAYMNNLEKATLPESIDLIGEGAFYEDEFLTEINLPKSLTKIGKDAFYNCKSLCKIKFPESLKELGKCAFKGCVNLNASIENTKIEFLEEGVFYGCKHLSTNLPKNIKEISANVFTYCENMPETLFLPDSLEKINEYFAQFKTPIKTFTGHKINKNIKESLNKFAKNKWEKANIIESDFVYNNLQYTDDTYTTCIGLVKPFDKEVVEFHPNTEKIITNDFKNNTTIRKIIFPKNLKIIKAHFDNSCINGFDFGDCENLKSFDHVFFKNCAVTEYIILPPNLKSIGNSCFKECQTLSEIKIPSTLQNIGIEAFAFSGIKKIDLSKTAVKKINKSCFTHSLLEKIILPYTVNEIDENAFSNTFLESINLSNTTINKLSNALFSNCSNLKNIELPATLKTIEPYALSELSLDSLCLPRNVNEIQEYAFFLSIIPELTLPDKKNAIHINIKAFECAKIYTCFYNNISPITEKFIKSLLKNTDFIKENLDYMIEKGKSFKEINKAFKERSER